MSRLKKKHQKPVPARMPVPATQTPMRSAWDTEAMTATARPASHFDAGSKLAEMLTVVPESCRATAIATCRFQVMGWQKGNHNGDAPRSYSDKPFRGEGRWVYTRLQSYGHLPSGRFSKCGPRSNWVKADSFAGADSILGCFGLTMDEVLQHFGNVTGDSRLQLDLVDIVTEMRPDLVAAKTPEMN